MKKIVVLLAVLCLSQSLAAQTRFDLHNNQDTNKVCHNPHKGLYHHFYDNGTWGYKGSVEEMLAVPGHDHLLIRLAWSFFEPSENNFNWSYVDDLVRIYEPLGFKFAFVFTCKETNMEFATPEWVKEAGAKGQTVVTWSQNVWEPDYGDPIFLEKLNNFHAAVAERYQDKPWLAYVQVGSYGTWGEGHNWPASDMVASNEVIKKHIDIYLNNYTNPQVRISMPDDAYGRSQNKPDLKNYVESNNMFWTDHSIMVKHYVDRYPETFSVQLPELFEDTWRTRPTHLELQHYHTVKQDGNWSVPDGATKGASMVKNAARLMHATWLGWHGNARTWVNENPVFSKEIANLVGYWYGVNFAEMPDTIAASDTETISLEIKNMGYAPAYHVYQAKFKFENDSLANIITFEDSNNTDWLPDSTYLVGYDFEVPTNLPDGEYKVKFKLFDDLDTKRNIDLAINDYFRDIDGYFTIGTIQMTGGEYVPVTDITMDTTSISLEKNLSYQLTSQISPADASNQSVLWSSSDESIATVSQTGIVKAISDSGEATISVTTIDGSKTDVCLVKATPVVIQDVRVRPITGSIIEGNAIQLSVQIIPTDAQDKSVTWHSADTNIATVSETGRVVGISDGKVMIGATAEDGGMVGYSEITVTSTTTIENPGQELKSVMEIFPNPSNGVIYVKSKEVLETVFIFDLSGKQIYSYEPVREHSISFHPQLSPGMYILKINGRSSKLMIK